MHEIEEKTNVENLIYEIRGKQIIFDRNLAFLYKTETRIINQIVKRNIERFPEEFCFQLTEEEFKIWKSQNVMSDNDKKGLRRPPYAFTEQGVAMMSALLKSDIAIVTSIKIINTFVKMRSYISNNLIEQKYINNQVMKNTEDIKILQETFDKFKPKINEIYFNGQIYDAYSKIVDILTDAEKEIILIDNYADKNVLDLISKINKNVILITKKIIY